VRAEWIIQPCASTCARSSPFRTEITPEFFADMLSILKIRDKLENMKTTESIKETLAEHRAELKKLFKVQEIGLFGSYVRDQQNESSDVDILVEFDEPIGLISFVGLKNYLSDLLGVEVDLVMKNALKPRIGKRILKEVVYV